MLAGHYLTAGVGAVLGVLCAAFATNIHRDRRASAASDLQHLTQRRRTGVGGTLSGGTGTPGGTLSGLQNQFSLVSGGGGGGGGGRNSSGGSGRHLGIVSSPGIQQDNHSAILISRNGGGGDGGGQAEGEPASAAVYDLKPSTSLLETFG